MSVTGSLGEVTTRYHNGPKRQSLARLSLAQMTTLPTEVTQEGRFGSLFGRSAPMRKVYELIQKVAPRNAPVIILGETGTGKELIAREIHANSTWADGAPSSL
jgi:DNA-binding NtrC family response regulator